MCRFRGHSNIRVKQSARGHSKYVPDILLGSRGHSKHAHRYALVGTAGLLPLSSHMHSRTSTATLSYAQQNVYCYLPVGTAIRLLLTSRRLQHVYRYRGNSSVYWYAPERTAMRLVFSFCGHSSTSTAILP